MRQLMMSLLLYPHSHCIVCSMLHLSHRSWSHLTSPAQCQCHDHLSVLKDIRLSQEQVSFIGLVVCNEATLDEESWLGYLYECYIRGLDWALLYTVSSQHQRVLFQVTFNLSKSSKLGSKLFV